MIDFYETIKSLPPEVSENLLEKNRKAFFDQDITLIVLDDDPTGTQTIFNVPVITSWGETEIYNELQNKTPLFFILTNSRSLLAKQADKLASEIGRNIRIASEKTGRRVIVISRGDSTLRGHYPNEVDALGNGLETEGSPHILIPAFFQGGRHTINDIHYVREGDKLIPSGETPFAKDSTFGYKSSNLKDYVEEKSAGRIKSSEVVSISLNDIRVNGIEHVSKIVSGLKKSQVCIVNAATQTDLDVFVSGFYRAQKNKYKSVLFRTAASVIPSLVGLPIKPPLSKNEFNLKGKGGLVAIGSYVPKTTLQLEYLKQHLNAVFIEIEAKKLLSEIDFQMEVRGISIQINENLKKNKLVIVFTSREIIKGETAEKSLQIVNQISNGMVKIILNLKQQPRFIIAKGGITSSDILTKSLFVKKAYVLGQIIPGVPVWKLNDCVAFPDLTFMPFPGNLGEKETLFAAIQKLI